MVRRLITVAALCGLAAAGFAQDEAAPVGKLPDGVTPHAYTLELRIDPTQEHFSGQTEITVTIDAPTDRIWIHGRDLDVTRASFEGAEGTAVRATYEEMLPSGVAELRFDDPVSGKGVLTLEYRAPFNQRLTGLYKVMEGGDAYTLTQFEAMDARQAFPGFDEPRFKTPFDLAVTSPAGVTTISGAPEVSAEDVGDGWVRHVFDTTRPLPTYLVVMAVGPYDIVEWDDIPPNDVRDRPIPLRGLAAKGKAEGGKFDYALEHTNGILTALERYFGTPYPYEKLDLVAAPQFAFGAMENPGAITYLEPLLLIDPKTASLAQRRDYAGVHAHELAHQWFGNLVTPVWWTDIWLNESFATWMGDKARAAWDPSGEFDRHVLAESLRVMHLDRLASTRQIREPVERNEEVFDAFDSITYLKGGGVLAMVESYLGEDTFQQGVRLHMTRHADSVADADDFFQSIADAAGDPDVVDAFRSFVEQPGVPLVRAELQCDAEGGRVALAQSRYRPLGSTIDAEAQTWKIPICLATGRGAPQCVIMSEKRQTVELDDDCGDWINLNAGGYGYYRFDVGDEGWRALLAEFERLDPAEQRASYEALNAALNAGLVSAETWLLGVEAAANAEAWDVAGAPTVYLANWHRRLPPDAREELSALGAALYADRLASLDGDDSVAATLLHEELTEFVARYTDAPTLRAELTAGAGRFLGLDGTADEAALDPNTRDLALEVAVEERGAPVFNAVMERLKTERNQTLRQSLAGAVSRVTDPALAARLRDAALTDMFTSRELVGIINGLMRHESTRPATWEWFQTHYDTIFEQLPDPQRPAMPLLASSFCDATSAKEVEAYFKKKAIPGAERSLAQALEVIRLCSALEAQEQELITALGRRVGSAP